MSPAVSAEHRQRHLRPGRRRSRARHASGWFSAGEQALSSSVQAGIGLAIGIALAALFPVVRRRMALANGIAGALLIVSAGVLLAVG